MKPSQTGQKRCKQGQVGASSAAREFGQLALWMAATFAGMVSAVLISRGPYFRKLGDQVGRSAGKQRTRSLGYGRPTRAESLPMLAEAIVGNSRHNVVAVFGPPRNAVIAGTYAEGETAPRETWYYPMRQEHDLAMAIEFDDDHARHVEFFNAPAVAA